MAAYSVIVKNSAKKELKKLPDQVLSRIAKVIDGLVDDAFPEHCRKLAGSQSAYRVREGQYRVIYSVIEKTIFILRVAHRKDAYRKPMPY